jgi:outer membrane protein assembly factor BamB
MHSRTASAAAILLVFGLFALPDADGREWTRFRGPNGQGQSDAVTIPTEWTAQDVNWQIDLPGIGHSSPVIWDQKLFVASAKPDTGARVLFCIRTTDGHKLWEKELAGSTHGLHPQNTYASSTPSCDGEHVYFAWATPEQYNLAAFDHAGNQIWQRNLGACTSKHGFGTSPIVYDDMVIITNDQDGESWVAAVDRKSGETCWKIPREQQRPQNASYSTPLILTREGREPELILHSWAHGISSHDPRTGSVNWEATVFDRRPVSSPVLVAGLIVGSCGDGAGTNSVVAIRPGDSNGKKAEIAYKIPRAGAPYVPTLVAADDLLFLWKDDGVLTCLDAASGKQHYRQRVGGQYHSSPIRVGDRIFCLSADSEMVVIAASKEYQILARNKVADDLSRATPAVADGRMYVRTQSKLFSIGGKKG